MNGSSRTLLSLVPGEFLGFVVLCLIVAGGFAIMLGMRRQGTALLLAGISLPFLSLARDILRFEVMAAAPDALRGPLSWLATVVLAMFALLAVLRLLLGREIFTQTISQTLGTLLADVIKWTARRFTSRLGCLAALAVMALITIGVLFSG